MTVDTNFIVARCACLSLLAFASACRDRVSVPDDLPVSPPIPAAYAAPISSNLCVMPVIDGEPQASENYAAFRMVSNVITLPGHPSPWILNHNRDEYEWTIDATGRYAPFVGSTPRDTFGLNFIVEEPAGRIVGASDKRLLQLLPGQDAFRVVSDLRANNGSSRVSLARLPREQLTLVSHADTVSVLTGETLSEWSEAEDLSVAGLRGFWKTFDLPQLDATIFADGWNKVAIRFDDGRWETIVLPPEDHDYIENAQYAPGSDAILLRFARRTAIIQFASDDTNWKAPTVVRHPRRSAGHAGAPFIPIGGKAIIRSSDKPSGNAAWQTLKAGSWQPVAGGDFAFRVQGKYSDTFARMLRIGRFVSMSSGNLMMFDGIGFHAVPHTTIEEVGALPEVLALSVIDKMVLNTEHGLFELRQDLVRMERGWPFVTGGLPKPQFIEAKLARQVIVIADDGIFAIAPDGQIERVPGGELIKVGFGDHFAGEIPVSGDLIINANNALHLVTTERSERWARCKDGLSAR